MPGWAATNVNVSFENSLALILIISIIINRALLRWARYNRHNGTSVYARACVCSCVRPSVRTNTSVTIFLDHNFYHGGESRDTTTTTMTHIWKNPPTSGKKIFNNSVNTWPIGIWFEAEKAERLRGFAWCVRFFKQHLIKKLLTSKQIIQGKKFVCSSITFLSGVV